MAAPFPQTEDVTMLDDPFAIASDQKPTLHTLQPLVRLLVISHREIKFILGEALAHTLATLNDGQWKFLGGSKNVWRTLLFSL